MSRWCFRHLELSPSLAFKRFFPWKRIHLSSCILSSFFSTANFEHFRSEHVLLLSKQNNEKWAKNVEILCTLWFKAPYDTFFSGAVWIIRKINRFRIKTLRNFINTKHDDIHLFCIIFLRLRDMWTVEIEWYTFNAFVLRLCNYLLE